MSDADQNSVSTDDTPRTPRLYAMPPRRQHIISPPPEPPLHVPASASQRQTHSTDRTQTSMHHSPATIIRRAGQGVSTSCRAGQGTSSGSNSDGFRAVINHLEALFSPEEIDYTLDLASLPAEIGGSDDQAVLPPPPSIVDLTRSTDDEAPNPLVNASAVEHSLRATRSRNLECESFSLPGESPVR